MRPVRAWDGERVEQKHPGDSLHLRRDRATSFGSVAGVYDRVRPTYPDTVIDDLLSPPDAGPAPRDVLDVGCGTGRAAVQFAARGCRVLGVEPDAAMAEVARGHGVEVEVASFEDWDAAGRRFDLLVAGQAWHWVEPVAGGRKAATLLRPGGRVGLFWNMDSMRPQDRAALDAVYEREAPALQSRRRSYGGKHDPREAVQRGLRDAGFADVTVTVFPWQRTYTPDEYVELLQTFSDHNLLPSPQRERLLTGVREVLTGLGELVVSYDCQLVSGRIGVARP